MRAPAPALSLALTITLTLVPARAHAQNAPPSSDAVAEARAHFDRGVNLYDGGDFDGALAEFNRSYDLSRRPNVLFNISATYQALHRYPDAAAALRRYLDLPDGARLPRRAEAENALREITALIAHVRVTADPAGAAVTVDGHTVEAGTDVELGPGHHLVRAEMDGFRNAHEELQLTSGESRTVTLRLVPLSQAPELTAGQTGFVVRGAPQGAVVVVDGQTYGPNDAVILTPGAHHVAVRAAGMLPWEGDIPLVAGGAHTLRVALAPVRRGLDPAFGGVGVAFTVLFAAGAITTGVLALQTHAEFISRTQSDPDAASLADRGRALSITADALGIATLLGAGITAYCFSRADFGPKHSNVELGFAPLPAGGGMLGLGGRF